MDLYIIGAGDVGGFIAYHAQDMGAFCLKGFLDDDVSKHDQMYYGLPVLGGIDSILNSTKSVAVAVAVASPRGKEKIVNKLVGNSLIQFPSFVHPTVWVGRNTKIQRGCIIYPGVSINYETIVNDFSTINMNCAIGHNCTLGTYSTLSPGVNLGGFTEVGRSSFIGIGASTIQGTNIGPNVTVGGMTVILNSVPGNVTIVGNPGKIIRKEQ